MGRKVKYNKELKLEIIKRYIKGQSASKLANEHGMPESMTSRTFKWVHRYEILGESAFDLSSTNKSYSSDLKLKVIKNYLGGGVMCYDLSDKYNISTSEIVRQWMMKYNRGIEIKDYDPKSEVYTIKARIRRKHSNYIKSKPEQVRENVLYREFEAHWKNQKWCTVLTLLNLKLVVKNKTIFICNYRLI